ncbi:MAG TPA: ABC transporter ATP-binding protein [Longimicrobiales bacterium]|nr:ABC transporter ATP-binding protein [Longimicrobiales bacterium]
MSPAISVRDLTRRFGDFTAVHEATFDVQRGEIFGFLGPNGAGKTTTIRMLCGLLPPTSGHATVAGLDVRRDAAALRARIGYMSQSFSLYPDLTVSENIELFAGLYDVTGERFAMRRKWLLDMADLRGRERHVTGELPLGFKQRLALGCAVLHEPPILFLDEPTSGVDPLARRRFWDLIHALAQGGTTILVSTHYMEEAEYCNRLLLMNRGRVIADGAPSALRASMAEPILEITTDDAPLAVEALTGAPGVIDAAMFGRLVHVVVEEVADTATTIRGVLRDAGRTVEDVRTVQPSLEDVFVSLVRREGGAVAG